MRGEHFIFSRTLSEGTSLVDPKDERKQPLRSAKHREDF
jgi:hypothetical protein